MMGLLLSLFGLKGPGVRPHPAEAPGAEGLDLDRRLEVPPLADRLRTAEGFLPDLSPSLSRALLRDVARRFFAYVVDLPASERHHHSEPWGLIHHSLEVAEQALRAAQSEFFVSDTRAYPEDQEYRLPRLRYAAWFFALLHDAGKFAEILVHGPKLELWNPYDETLEAFFLRHGRDHCSLSWKARRGFDAHSWQNAYLMGLLLSGEVGRYLGRTITGEMIERDTPAAREIERLISDADHRSTRESLALQARARQAPPPDAAPVAFLVGGGGGEYLGRIPGALAQGVALGILRMNDLAAEVWVGRRHLLLRYPAALKKLVPLLKDDAGREYGALRALRASEEGARDLAGYLHRHRKLVYDLETDAWKMKAKIVQGSGFEVTGAVLLDRAFLEPALARLPALALFEGEIALSRAVDDQPLRVDDWTLPVPARLAPLLAPAPALPEAPPGPEGRVLEEKAPPKPLLSPSLLFPSLPTPAVPVLRRFVSSELLFQDIHDAILSGVVPANQWNQPCFVLEDVTYLASPRGFQCLVDRGLYDRDPKREVNVYLDALAKEAAVRKRPGGRVLTQVLVRPGARPLWVVAFDTKGLFRDASEIAQIGYWTESPIREISEDEARALRAACPLPTPAAPLALEAPHA